MGARGPWQHVVDLSHTLTSDSPFIPVEGKTFPLAVKEGDRILFGKYSGTEIKIDGEEFIIMKEEEVLGTLSGASTPAKKELAGSRR